MLFGGRSSEHEVSCTTAGGVLGAIDRDRWNVIAVGIGRDGSWTVQSDDPSEWALTEERMPHVVPSSHRVMLPASADSTMWRQESAGVVRGLGEVDVAFPLLHGPWGEDGTIQGAMELVDVRYVGSGVLASAIGMDKQFMKAAFRAQGLPVADDVVLAPGQSPSSVSRRRLRRSACPCSSSPPARAPAWASPASTRGINWRRPLPTPSSTTPRC